MDPEVLTKIPQTQEAITEAIDESMRTMINKKLTRTLLGLVDEMAAFLQEADTPKLGGNGKSSIKNGVLDFVVFTTEIMGLDDKLSAEVASLKRVLLAQVRADILIVTSMSFSVSKHANDILLLWQLKVREFNKLSNFQNPTASYLLRDVICNYCNTCRCYN
jgi:hypothetical protein